MQLVKTQKYNEIIKQNHWKISGYLKGCLITSMNNQRGFLLAVLQLIIIEINQQVDFTEEYLVK